METSAGEKVLELVSKGEKVQILCKDSERTQLRRHFSTPQIGHIVCDLGSLVNCKRRKHYRSFLNIIHLFQLTLDAYVWF